MPLTATDKTQLYSDAFARNSKAMLGESAFAALDLMTQRDVANMEAGVLRDELQAAQDSEASLREANEKLKTANRELRATVETLRAPHSADVKSRT